MDNLTKTLKANADNYVSYLPEENKLDNWFNKYLEDGGIFDRLQFEYAIINIIYGAKLRKHGDSSFARDYVNSIIDNCGANILDELKLIHDVIKSVLKKI
jgi:hypothetical protein